MGYFEVRGASVREIDLMRDWAEEEGWNPGDTDRLAFTAADPQGFLIGRLDGEPVGCISAVRYGTGSGFIGFYITRPEVRGQGYGIRLWRAGMERLAGRVVGLDGVVGQQENYRRSGFVRAWNNVRFEGPPTHGAREPQGVVLVDGRSLPLGQLAAYDRRFFPEARDAFLAAWVGLPGRASLAAVRDGELCGFGVVRPCSGASRVGPLYAADPEVAEALFGALATAAGGGAVAVDVPDHNGPALKMAERLGLSPSFEAARMYVGPVPDTERAGVFGVTSLELG
ncbi:GNAT family N-acetyltransferase [Streptomyces xantholiticus]|uniref:GNAT family N-acetyltransferase n=1 Tax=Streptomyces xantholiticus TaxID=68285 RepID=UPI001676F536|nr:GNAT family N-acetyltransferase [Streptomyces xantholiticus]GGW52543.1 N-acetyltransferase GCN5 [Streptomyces xantholiticus]